MRLVLVILLAGLCAGAQAAPIPLARGGKPVATLVLPEEAPSCLRDAAADVQRYVRKLCGVKLPIRRDGKRVEGTGLYLGKCEPSLPSDPPDGALNPEAYAIRVREGSVFFAGRYPTATTFAVFSFIEEALGVRWFAPGEAWEYVPAGRPGELTVEVTERVKVPDTSPRVWSGHAWIPSWQQWNARNKTVQSEVVPRRQFQNFLNRVFPPEKYGKTHPEYYPLIDGKRWIPGPGERYWRPCESNPEVLRLTVEYARQWFDTHPDVDSFSVGMDDISHLCGCPACRAMDPHPDSYEKHEFSDRHYKFVNAVAREIAKTHPGRYIGTLIYAIARKPPETVPKLEENVFGFITENCSQWWEPEVKDADHALTREWRARCKHLSRYDYYGLGTFTPRYYPHHMAEQIKFDKALGLEGMYVEVYTFLPHTAPMMWALSKLQWDASLNIDALLNEFTTKLFGRAAGTMARYFDLLEKSYNTPRPGHEVWEHRHIVQQALAMAPEEVDAGLALLAQAKREAESDGVRARIETIRAALQYSGYAIKAYDLSRRLLTTPVENHAQAELAVRQSEAIMRLSAERERFWAEAMRRDDLLGENLRGLSGQGYLMTGRVSQLEAGGVVGALKALAWYGANAPAELPAVGTRLAKAAPAGDVGRAVRAYLSMEQAKPVNLAANPGFEERAENQAAPQQDWQTKGAPAGWSTWSRAGDSRFGVLPGVGRNGSCAASIAGGVGGTYLQTVKARPGERYLCLVWAKYTGEKPAGHFGIRFQTAAGAWHPRRDLEPEVELAPATDWQPLILFVTVPEGAGQFVLMPGCGALDAGAAVLFDDTMVCKIEEGQSDQ